MRNVRVELSADREDLYEPLMRGACTIAQVEAAYRLVFQVEPLWDWLLQRGFIELSSDERYDCLEVRLQAALEHVREKREAPVLEAGSSGKSASAVLTVAANLAGKDNYSLRNTLYDLDEDHMRLVVEAMMYAAGYLDGSADPWGNEDPSTERGWGTNSRAREERLEEM
ncbi:hypothetical protein ACFXG8_40470 [Kitasatospora indigofera]|uniref:hypothetical protein n=2 Tax=Kitasatospora indigofera TaxID=67307 RepID=UPI00367B8400